jgi:DNA transposition AAA+ family ATPase
MEVKVKKVFAKTKNVKNFITVLNNIQNRPEGVPGMALIYGEPGLGKSKTTIWWAIQNNAVLISAKNGMSSRWLLEELVNELGETPMYKKSDLFNQAVKQILEYPRVIIVDEIDYLTGDKCAIETLRDIHDRTGNPVVMIGMGMADKKLIRYKHLYDRISEILRFNSFDLDDVKEIIAQLAEVKITDEAIDFIHKNANRFRQIVKLINRAEKLAEANGLQEITSADLVDYITDIRKNGGNKVEKM